MNTAAARNDAARSAATPIERYLDGKITKDSYFREVRKETARQVERDLKQPSKK